MSDNLQVQWERAIARMAAAEEAGDAEAAKAWEDAADRIYARITGEATPDARLPNSRPWWGSRWFRFIVVPVIVGWVSLALVSSSQENAEADGRRMAQCGVKYGFDRADRTALGDIAYKACMEADE
jgi:hypothetical protein